MKTKEEITKWELYNAVRTLFDNLEILNDALDLAADYPVLLEQNKRYERVLEYYADDRIYDPQYKLDIMRDTGKLARETLKELKK